MNGTQLPEMRFEATNYMSEQIESTEEPEHKPRKLLHKQPPTPAYQEFEKNQETTYEPDPSESTSNRTKSWKTGLS